MQSERSTARVVGILFIVATAAAVIGDALLRPLRDDADYLAEFAANEGRVILAVLTELTLAVAVIAIAVLLFPVLKRVHEGMALGYVGVRILEGTIILAGGLSSLLLLTLSQNYVESAAPDVASFHTSGELLLEAREWTDSLGTTIVFGLSALILYTLLYQSRLVPRWLSAWGFIGGVMVLTAGVLRLFGESSTSPTSILLTVPIGINEMVLAVWLIVRGFNSSPTTSETAGTVPHAV